MPTQETVLKSSLQKGFSEAMSDVDPLYRKKETARLIPGEEPDHFKLYMIDNHTDRALNEININRTRKQVENRIDDVLEDYKDLQSVIDLKLRTIGIMTSKLEKRKFKIVV